MAQPLPGLAAPKSRPSLDRCNGRATASAAKACRRRRQPRRSSRPTRRGPPSDQNQRDRPRSRRVAPPRKLPWQSPSARSHTPMPRRRSNGRAALRYLRFHYGFDRRRSTRCGIAVRRAALGQSPGFRSGFNPGDYSLGWEWLIWAGSYRHRRLRQSFSGFISTPLACGSDEN